MKKHRRIVAVVLVAAAPFVARQLFVKSQATNVTAQTTENAEQSPSLRIVGDAVSQKRFMEKTKSFIAELQTKADVTCGLDVSEIRCAETLEVIVHDWELCQVIALLRLNGVIVYLSGRRSERALYAGYVGDNGTVVLYPGESLEEYRKFLLRK